MQADVGGPDCAEKNCDEPGEYGITLRYGSMRVELYFCGEHFDQFGRELDRLDIGTWVERLAGQGDHASD